MKQNVTLTIRGRQLYENQEPEIIELICEGTMEPAEDGWDISYEESALTGMEGVTTVFRVRPEKVILERTGKLQSRMVFRLGVLDESLYRMEFGALLIGVCATKLAYDLTEQGGTVDLVYGIDIEHNAGGVVEYHLDVVPI